MKKNKGYSLIELLITLAIFSIVMVALILIMRTSLVSYREGLFESSAQEEAQIVLNQVSELLVDSRGIVSASNPYIFKSDDGVTNFSLTWDGDHTLYYDGQVLSDSVSNFSISGLEVVAADHTTHPADNAAIITLDVDYHGATYNNAQREVFFRNNIENPLAYDVQFGSGGGSPSPTPTDKDDIAMLRFDYLDLSAQYGIVYDCDISAVPWIEYCTTSNTTGYTNNTYVKTALSGKTPTHYAVKVVDSLNDPASGFGTHYENGGTTEYKITGTDANGNSVELLVHLDAVDFDEGPGIYEQYVNMTNNSGYPTNVIAKGINMEKARTASGMNIKYDIQIYHGASLLAEKKDVGLQAYDPNQDPQVPDLDNKSGVGNANTEFQMGLLSDKNSPNLIITSKNGMQAKSWHKNMLGSEDGTQKLHFKVTFQRNGGGTYVQEIDEKFYLVGKSLKNA